MNSAAEVPLEIDVQAVKELQSSGEPFYFLDCREPDEYETASIVGAELIPMGEINDRLAELEPYRNGRIIVHCHHGRRSLNVTHALRQAGFSETQSMAGGIDAWSVEIDPSVPRY
ncbi:rhodanese-like domain-containing protein [Planctomycetaceae bacterium SH139]